MESLIFADARVVSVDKYDLFSNTNYHIYFRNVIRFAVINERVIGCGVLCAIVKKFGATVKCVA